MKKKLTQEVFKGQPTQVNWCGIDYDGLQSFGIAINPRYTWASERWRGFKLIGETIPNSEFEPLTSLYKLHQSNNEPEHLLSEIEIEAANYYDKSIFNGCIGYEKQAYISGYIQCYKELNRISSPLFSCGD